MSACSLSFDASNRRTIIWRFPLIGLLLASTVLTAQGANDQTARYRFLIDAQRNIQTVGQALAAMPMPMPPRPGPERAPLLISIPLQAHPIWVHARIPAGTEYLVISGGWLSAFDLYLLDGARIVRQHRSGSMIPAAAREVPDPRFAFRIPASAANDLSFMIRHHSPTKGRTEFPIQYFSHTEYERDAMLLHLRHGAYYGLLLIVLCFTLGTWCTSRARAQLYFSSYVIGLMLSLSTHDGFLGAYALPQSPEFLWWLIPLAIGTSIASLLMFAVHFLDVDTRWPAVATLFRVSAALILGHSLISAQWPSLLSTRVEITATVVAGMMHLILAMYLVWKRQRLAAFYLLSLLPIVAASSTVALSSFSASSVFLFSDALFIGACAQLLILSIALGVTLKREQEDRANAVLRANSLGRQVQQLQAITNEATKLRSIQRSIQDAQRVRSINQLASGIAHDFNNIFTSIMGFSELLNSPLADADPARRNGYAQQINTAGQRGAALVKQLLLSSRGTKPDIRLLDLGASVAQITDFIRRGLPLDVGLTVELPKQRIDGLMDEDQLRQLLINLVVNASEAMAFKGGICVRLERTQIQTQQCSACLNRFGGERIILSVLDRGPGLSQPAQELFTPFFTSKPIGQGSGLGLSVIDGIVHEHGGHLIMANRIDGGVRVDVCLPATTVPQAAVSPQARLLFVHTENSAGTATLQKLQRYYQVATASSAAGALERFLDNHRCYGLAVIEVAPPHTTWLEIASDMRRANPNLPILFLTSDTQAQLALTSVTGDLQPAPFTRFLDISTEQPALLSTVESLLNPPAGPADNIQSLRQALRRLQTQPQ